MRVCVVMGLTELVPPRGRAVTPWFPAPRRCAVVGSWHALVEAGGLSEEKLWRARLHLRALLMFLP